MSYDLRFSKPNKSTISATDIEQLFKNIKSNFPKVKASEKELHFDFCQVSIYENFIMISIPFWEKNIEIEFEINSLIKTIFNEGYWVEDAQTEQKFESFSESIFENYKITAKQVLGHFNKDEYLCSDIRCSKIGTKEFVKILADYNKPLPLEMERKYVSEKAYKELFYNYLSFTVFVAKKFKFRWIPFEEMVDASINGFEKGLSNFLEHQPDFKIVEYTIWWAQQSCIEYLLQKIWSSNFEDEEQFYSNEKINNLRLQWQDGDTRVIKELLDKYSFLFKKIESLYRIELDDKARALAIENALWNKSSLPFLEQKEYLFYKNELDFEAFVFLEYSIMLEECLITETDNC